MPHEEQPMPQGGTGDAWAEIIQSLDDRINIYKKLINTTAMETLRKYAVDRRALGIERYHQPLKREDGRDHIRDVREELLDALSYSKVADLDKLHHMILVMILANYQDLGMRPEGPENASRQVES